MKFRVTTSGGFAGLEESEMISLDTRDLTAEVRGDVERQIKELLAKPTPPPMGADMFRYDVEIEDEQGRHQLTVMGDEGETGEALQQLLTTLQTA